MGKAEITTNLGNGQYTIDLLRDLTKLQAEIGRINNEINKLTSISIPEAQTNLSHSESVEKIAQSNLSNAIASGAENLLSFITIHRKAIAEVDSNTSTLGILEAKSISLQKRLDLLNTETLGPAQSAWCTDLTPDLSGEVATIEVPGERKQVFIRPGYTDNAVHSPARDGQLQPVYSNTSSAAFFNAALLPGWQKWNPQYRTGTITFISEDKSTCSVSLDAEQSTAQNLGVNKETALTGVTFSYMSCNGAAFSVGDSVVIEFPNRDWDTARVIGFTDNPKACQFYIRFTLNGLTPTKNSYQIKVTYGAEEATSETSYSILDLVGPFTAFDSIAYAYLHYKRTTKEIFHFYENVGIDGDWDEAGYLIERVGSCADVPDPNYVDENFSDATPAHVDTQLYLKRVLFKKYATNLANLTPSYEDIGGGVMAPVYTIDFSGLKIIRKRSVLTYPEILYINLDCGWNMDQDVIDSYEKSIGGILSNGCSSDVFSSFFEKAGSWYSAYIVWAFYKSSFTINSQVIITDENGLSPTFTNTAYTLSSRIYDTSSIVRITPEGDYIETICSVGAHVDYTDVETYTYSMVDTPESELLQ